jgi:hypothetical protein
MTQLFEDSRLIVHTNGCGEIFVQNKADGKPMMRITPDGDELCVTAHDGVLTPWAINRLPAFLVQGKR